MKSFEQLAQAAYEAFQAQAGIDPKVSPHWSSLTPQRKRCWIVAAMKVAEEIASIR